MFMVNILKLFLYSCLTISIVFAKNNNKNKSLLGSQAKFWMLKDAYSGKFEKLNNYVSPKESKWKAGKERKVVVMSFFATWCKPCIKEIQELEILQNTFKDDPVKFFLINLTEYYRYQSNASNKYKDAPDAVDFFERKGWTDFSLLNDPNGRTKRAYDVTSLPRIVIIDKFNNIVLDETGLCPSCIIDEIEPLLEKIVQAD